MGAGVAGRGEREAGGGAAVMDMGAKVEEGDGGNVGDDGEEAEKAEEGNEGCESEWAMPAGRSRPGERERSGGNVATVDRRARGLRSPPPPLLPLGEGYGANADEEADEDEETLRTGWPGEVAVGGGSGSEFTKAMGACTFGEGAILRRLRRCWSVLRRERRRWRSRSDSAAAADGEERVSPASEPPEEDREDESESESDDVKEPEESSSSSIDESGDVAPILCAVVGLAVRGRGGSVMGVNVSLLWKESGEGTRNALKGSLVNDEAANWAGAGAIPLAEGSSDGGCCCCCCCEGDGNPPPPPAEPWHTSRGARRGEVDDDDDGDEAGEGESRPPLGVSEHAYSDRSTGEPALSLGEDIRPLNCTSKGCGLLSEPVGHWRA